MTELFLQVVNMSISAGWIVLTVLILRFLLKRAPRWICVLLWGIVGVRLALPFSIESVLSLMPSAQTISPDIMFDSTPTITTGIPILNSTVNPIISSSFAPEPAASANPLQILIPIASVFWAAGIAILLAYTALSYAHLRKKIGTAVLLRDNIYQSERVASPFVLGLIKPKIYLPFNMSGQNTEHVIAHENAHLARRDHLWKPLGFLLLTVHWFNPLVWLGYILLCRDIELACDERVVMTFSTEQKADYSQALLACSVNRRMIAACPLAFGEIGVKDRVKSVLSYKKPAFWVVAVAIAASATVAVCFLTSPKDKLLQSSGSDLAGVSAEIVSINYDAPDPYIEIKWINNTDREITFGEEFYIYRHFSDSWEDCRIDLDYVVNLLGYPVSAGRTRTHKYGLNMLDMGTAGKYRFEADFTISGAAPDKYKVWLEFETAQGIAPTAVFTFDPEVLVYDHGMFSYIQSADAAPTYLLINDMQLAKLSDDGELVEIGALESIELNDDNFDSRFSQSDYSWFEGSLKDLKDNNKRAWQTKTKRGKDTILYLLLEQSDGIFYLGYGYADMSLEQKPNPDNSLIRWLYRLKVVTANQSESTVGGADEPLNAVTYVVTSSDFPIEMADIENMNIGAEMPQLIYADREKVIFTGTCGIIVYNYTQDALTDRINHNALSAYGITLLNAHASRDGGTVYIGNAEEPHFTLEYDIVANVLFECDTQPNNLFERTALDFEKYGKFTDKQKLTGEFMVELENNLIFLQADTDWSMKSLQLVICDKATGNKTVKSPFLYAS